MVARFILNSIHNSSSSSGERPKLELSKPTVARLSHQPSFSPAKAAAAEVGTCTDLDFFVKEANTHTFFVIFCFSFY